VGALEAAEAHLQGMFVLIEMGSYDQQKQLDVRMVLLYAVISHPMRFFSYG
jgi:hypothetical protein